MSPPTDTPSFWKFSARVKTGGSGFERSVALKKNAAPLLSRWSGAIHSVTALYIFYSESVKNLSAKRSVARLLFAWIASFEWLNARLCISEWHAWQRLCKFVRSNIRCFIPSSCETDSTGVVWCTSVASVLNPFASHTSQTGLVLSLSQRRFFQRCELIILM